jgi:hypothetical protein
VDARKTPALLSSTLSAIAPFRIPVFPELSDIPQPPPFEPFNLISLPSSKFKDFSHRLIIMIQCSNGSVAMCRTTHSLSYSKSFRSRCIILRIQSFIVPWPCRLEAIQIRLRNFPEILSPVRPAEFISWDHDFVGFPVSDSSSSS